MKRFTTAMGVILSAVGLCVGQSLAASPYWKVDMYQPTNGTTSHSVQIEFKALSTEASDNITIQLYENGSAVSGQTFTTTKPYGDSGFFTLANVADGTYSFHVTGTNNAEPGNTQTTPDQTVSVSTAQSTTIVLTQPTNSSSVNNTNSNAVTATSPISSVPSSTNGSENGTSSSASSNVNQGQINAPAPTNTKKNSTGKVLGVATAKNTTRNTVFTVIGTVVVVGALLYYLLFTRRSKLPK